MDDQGVPALDVFCLRVNHGFVYPPRQKFGYLRVKRGLSRQSDSANAAQHSRITPYLQWHLNHQKCRSPSPKQATPFKRDRGHCSKTKAVRPQRSRPAESTIGFRVSRAVRVVFVIDSWNCPHTYQPIIRQSLMGHSSCQIG